MQKKLAYAAGLVILAFFGFYLYQKFRVAPDLKMAELPLEDLSGQPFSLSAFSGKKTVLCFAASWCGPCRKELKMIGRIQKSELEDLNFVVISDEDIPEIENMKAQFPYDFTWLHLRQPFSALGVNSIPTTYLLNTKGQVVEQQVGAIDWEHAATASQMRGLME